MKVLEISAFRPALLALALGFLGCSEISARSHAREGNRLFNDGDYKAAVQEYTEAERLHPTLPVILLNKGLACRQLMVPGGKSAENQRAVDCALDAFKRLKEVNPADPRGDQLYIQTLFDAERWGELIRIFEDKLRAEPKDLASMSGLIQVYSRAGNWEKALHWEMERAKLQPKNAEAQYGVGVYIWNLLYQNGGADDKSTFDPRPGAKNTILFPQFNTTDIQGEQRARLADQGISYLQKAIELRPSYREAMTYLNLLYRQKSFAYFDRPEEWQAAVDAAETWRKKASGSG